MSTTSGLVGDGAGDAETLLLATGEGHPRFLELVLDLVPQGGLDQGLLHQIVVVALEAGDPRPVHDVLIDALRERVWLLKDHADPAPNLYRVHFLPVEVHPVVLDPALDPGGLDQVVHPIEATEDGRLATARRPDESGDAILMDRHVDVVHRSERSVIDGQASELEDRRAILGGLHRGRRVLPGGVIGQGHLYR